MESNNKRVKHYTEEFKDSVLKSLGVSTSEMVTSIWEDIGVSGATFYKWTKESKEN